VKGEAGRTVPCDNDGAAESVYKFLLKGMYVLSQQMAAVAVDMHPQLVSLRI
jgi:hypothetical protein